MNHIQKSVLTILSAVLLLVAVLCTAGCFSDSGESGIPSVTCGISVWGKYNDICLNMSVEEFNSYGFTVGDEVTLAFSNGKICEHVPYLSGFVAKDGGWVLVALAGEEKPVIGIQAHANAWTAAGVSETDTVTVTMESRGKYAFLDGFSRPLSIDKSDFSSDEAFANFRPVIGGKITENVIYRGASPVNNSQNRTTTVGELLQKYGIKTILDLSDSEEEAIGMMETYKDSTEVFMKYYAAGDIVFADLESNYYSELFAKKLVTALNEAVSHEAPIYIHCVEGKDRTGFVCMLIEALCGASYEEMKTDYLKTFENYYSTTPSSQPAEYEFLTKEKFEPMLAYIAGVPGGTDVSSLSQNAFVSGAKQYLKSGGMSDAEIEELIQTICGE